MLRTSVFCCCVSFAGAVEAQVGDLFASSDDSTAISISPNELGSAAQIDPEFSARLLEALRVSEGYSEDTISSISFFAAEKVIDQASWVQFDLEQQAIGQNSFIAIQSIIDGQVQIFTAEDAGQALRSASFNGPGVIMYAGVHPLDTEFEQSIAAQGIPIESAFWGLSPTEETFEEMGILGAEQTGESICGAEDDRTASNHPFVGRLMPVGCTGWLVGNGLIATAGHCVSDTMREIEFQVPQSNVNGSTIRADLRDQYIIDQSSIVYSENSRIGDDWAVFRVLPNSVSGLLPQDAQGGGFSISNETPPGAITIIGFGLDDSPYYANQTQQQHVGSLVGEFVRSGNDAVIKHTADTRGGNSGSPVLSIGDDGIEVAYGIHTNAGCMLDGGSNNATSFRNAALWSAITQVEMASDSN